MADSELYLFTGPEIGEKNEAIATIKALAQKKNGSLDVYSYYTADVRIQDVISQLQNESLFTQATFITLRNAEQIKTKSDIDLIVQWAKSAGNSPNTLILVSDENAVDKKLEAAVPSSHKKIFWEMFENQKPQWVQNFFRKNGFSVTSEAVESILDMVENNTEVLKSECSRFFYCFEKGHQITDSDVEKILAHNREENAFTLFEAMADSSKGQTERFENAVEILQKIRVSRDGAGVALIAGLTYCYRQLRTWHNLQAKCRQENREPSKQELAASGFSGKTNQTRYAKAAKVWTSGAVSSILALLASTDMSIREGGSSLEDTRLMMMIYAIVMKNGVYPAEYEDS